MTDPKIGERLKQVIEDERHGHTNTDTVPFLLHHLNELRRLAHDFEDSLPRVLVSSDCVRTGDARAALRRYLEELNGND